MKPKTRQTLIGVAGMVIVLVVGLMEGLNGKMMLAGAVAIGLLASGHLAEVLQAWSSK